MASFGFGGGTGEAGTALKRAVRHLLSRHVDVVYADIDLMAVGDVDEAAAELNELGFFAAGLVLHGPDGHDHLRLQLLDSEEIELEDVVCDSPFAEALRRRVLEDKARVGRVRLVIGPRFQVFGPAMPPAAIRRGRGTYLFMRCASSREARLRMHILRAWLAVNPCGPNQAVG